jgi:hypothetical protein
MKTLDYCSFFCLNISGAYFDSGHNERQQLTGFRLSIRDMDSTLPLLDLWLLGKPNSIL